MDIAQPDDMKVVSMAPYEYIHYQCSGGREFLCLCLELRFGTRSVNIELSDTEIAKLTINSKQFISGIRSEFIENCDEFEHSRHIKEFENWPVVKSALKKWHGR
ncbi:hypothetical protein A3752_18875 [Oleiphilus sp. HI0081]|uniref:hypothetical protein n=1 Tax=unclassified Oleiphilus TaxID=2631174 RepID=UPI0007C35447|nr:MULTISPECIES: hypothetical protein [unclassified Oleiphilus]KZY85637.1 hypothetical protein A3743_18830 [Oleiphilus sp. HI0072]KZZ20292.1 hypothetical protein A3749_19470 [Oleiphilus sp. HI0078]KZZ29513.1 hypothetical protein A3752_18875 [Oleiphilus sp. HI0081]KZY34359.1 hypothetical protein A3729_18340 [Oleiphilus sp. HI0043]KZY57837.1 hypothetical protein A3735_18315 [Oleiphilus sp. HI0061]